MWINDCKCRTKIVFMRFQLVLSDFFGYAPVEQVQCRYLGLKMLQQSVVVLLLLPYQISVIFFLKNL